MKNQVRTLEQLRRHYEVEKELADRLRRAAPEQRRQMYGSLYDELYRRIDDHPLLARKALAEDEVVKSKAISTQLKFLRKFLTSGDTFLEVGAGAHRIEIVIGSEFLQDRRFGEEAGGPRLLQQYQGAARVVFGQLLFLRGG